MSPQGKKYFGSLTPDARKALEQLRELVRRFVRSRVADMKAKGIA
jgi:hypothetical protein